MDNSTEKQPLVPPVKKPLISQDLRNKLGTGAAAAAIGAGAAIGGVVGFDRDANARATQEAIMSPAGTPSHVEKAKVPDYGLTQEDMNATIEARNAAQGDTTRQQVAGIAQAGEGVTQVLARAGGSNPTEFSPTISSLVYIIAPNGKVKYQGTFEQALKDNPAVDVGDMVSHQNYPWGLSQTKTP